MENVQKQLFSNKVFKYNQQENSDVWTEFSESTVCYNKVINFFS